jgi:hypothetical protein
MHTGPRISGAKRDAAPCIARARAQTVRGVPGPEGPVAAPSVEAVQGLLHLQDDSGQAPTDQVLLRWLQPDRDEQVRKDNNVNAFDCNLTLVRG